MIIHDEGSCGPIARFCLGGNRENYLHLNQNRRLSALKSTREPQITYHWINPNSFYFVGYLRTLFQLRKSSWNEIRVLILLFQLQINFSNILARVIHSRIECVWKLISGLGTRPASCQSLIHEVYMWLLFVTKIWTSGMWLSGLQRLLGIGWLCVCVCMCLSPSVRSSSRCFLTESRQGRLTLTELSFSNLPVLFYAINLHWIQFRL
jgi:hypothetical protein